MGYFRQYLRHPLIYKALHNGKQKGKLTKRQNPQRWQALRVSRNQSVRDTDIRLPT